MSRVRQGFLMRGFAILVVAIFSGAWTFSVAGMGGLSTISAQEPTAPGGLPDGSSVPSEAIDAPASVSDAATVEGSVNGNTAKIIAASSTNAIPAAALAAYQRAETVINKADKSCNITWQLIAAIGRVESNHGRTNGNSLNDDGVAKPGIYGPALNGTANTRAISDTDAGQYDKDSKWDRAVGPMQFIPSTWSVVGVDADDDAQRNPQDVDDSALATAVFLCSGEDNLATLTGQKASIFRYNNSKPYVELVLKIMDEYLDGDYTSVSGTTTAGGYVVPDPTPSTPGYGPGKNNGPAAEGRQGKSGSSSLDGSSTGSKGGSTGGDNGGNTPAPGTGGNNGGGSGPATGGGSNPGGDAGEQVTEGAKDAVEGLVNGLAGLIKPVNITVACTAYKLAHLLDPTAFRKCVDSYQD